MFIGDSLKNNFVVLALFFIVTCIHFGVEAAKPDCPILKTGKDICDLFKKEASNQVVSFDDGHFIVDPNIYYDLTFKAINASKKMSSLEKLEKRGVIQKERFKRSLEYSKIINAISSDKVSDNVKAYLISIESTILKVFYKKPLEEKLDHEVPQI